MTHAVFGAYHASRMAKSKWQALNHLMDTLWQNWSITYHDPACFESSQRRFKQNYRPTSGNLLRGREDTHEKETVKSNRNELFGTSINEKIRNFCSAPLVRGDQMCFLFFRQASKILQTQEAQLYQLGMKTWNSLSRRHKKHLITFWHFGQR